MTDGDKQFDRLAFLGSLAGGLAHEIKNPLSTMTVTLQLLKEDWQGASDARERRTLQKITLLQKEVNRLEGILNDFLRFARGPVLRVEDCEINELVQEVLDFIEPEATRYGIRVRFHGDRSSPRCRIDRNLVKQAIFNVVINAQHAMEEKGGELIVTTRRSGDSVRLDFVDTGCGMPPDVLGRIFHVYFSTKKGGTGLGLPTARRYIEEHDGTIEIRSEPEKGTIVTVTLPCSPDGERTAGEESGEGASRTKETEEAPTESS
jgi:signal transduction histidine kinase